MTNLVRIGSFTHNELHEAPLVLTEEQDLETKEITTPMQIKKSKPITITAFHFDPEVRENVDSVTL
jgi:hypothetical protein